MKKPLIFRSQRYGGDLAQRDNIQYEIKYSQWVDGKTPELPYHVTRWDRINKDHISTERVRRFATPEAAAQYCQEMYEGKIDLSALRAEIQADIAERESKRNKAERDGAEAFKDVLRQKGIALPDFLEVEKLWDTMNSDSRSLLYREAYPLNDRTEEEQEQRSGFVQQL